MKNVVFWDVTSCGSCENRNVLPLLVAVNVPSSPIPVTFMMETMCCSETSVLTGPTRRNIREDGILQVGPYLCSSI
jgi:hypothetical protein